MLDHAQSLHGVDVVTLIAAALLAVVAVGRAARLVTSDSYPPMQWLRLRWITWCSRTPRREQWTDLLRCPFCFAPYAAAVSLGWGLLSGLDWTSGWGAAWWIVHAWAALSYLAAIVVVYDEPPADPR